ncbi:MAG: DsrE family protein [Gammaproteobacteria bacterium]|nr:DsrE family protein [Gammaproteobacteria bacterium]
MKQRLTAAVTLAFMLGSAVPVFAGLDSEVDTLLAAEASPEGVVFEVVTNKREALDTALPQIISAVKRLRQRWSKLDIVIVTHGKEQFALTSANFQKHSGIHKQVQNLVKEASVGVHVCGTFAQRNNVAPEEFPDYVNVSASGPAQINDYKTLGYVVVLVTP